ncbi:MAG: hypothetical protein RLZ28_281 [Actinomycetota bacterium]|jgi:two-component system OmpR family sensor kinase
MALLKTYLDRNTDRILNATISALRNEDPVGLQARVISGQVHLPSLPSDYYISYVDPAGKELISLVSAATAQGDLPDLTSFTKSFVANANGMPFDVESLNPKTGVEKHWRIIAQPVKAQTQASVIIGLPTNGTQALLDQYRVIGISAGSLLLLFSGLAIWFTITGALRPLREVERTASAVAEGDISKRLFNRVGRTEISRLNRSLNTMLNSIEQAMDSRNHTLQQMRRFVADASHELRTPLVSVRGYAELYRMGALQSPTEVAEAMNRIESEAIRMGELVESLLTLARLDEGKRSDLNSIDLIALARSTAKDASVAAGGRNVEVLDLLGIPVMPDAQLFIEADANKIRQVLTNLLANANRFSPDGAKIEIAVGTPLGAQDGMVHLDIRDYGEGIPTELRDKVFERFFRADTSRNRETGGSGLGLAIVKAIVDRHGGSIVVEETAGGGATFKVRLPITQNYLTPS